MASDEIVWQVINQQFCSFKLKLNTKTQTFCRNEYNVTGFCSRQSCPLANSRYATVRPDPATDDLCLYIKTVERTHLPSQWWERVHLSNNYEKALTQIDEKLLYWPNFLTHKCKQRLTRLTQVAIRSRRIQREEERLGEKTVPRLASKIKRREVTRERKAESAAKVERAIERELIERLRSGAYGDRPLNVEEGVWKKVLRGLERAEQGDEHEIEETELAEEEGEGVVEYVSDIDEEEVEHEMEDFDDWLGGESADEADYDNDEEHEGVRSDDQATDSDENEITTGMKRKRNDWAQPGRKKPPRVEIEYEPEAPPRESVLA